MIVVMGATGNTGRVVVERLLTAGKKVRAMGRSADRLNAAIDRGAEPVIGDVLDPDTLASAFNGVDAAYAMVPPNYREPDPRVYYNRVGDAIEKAVRQSGVPRIVFLSSLGAELNDKTGPIAGLHDVEVRLTTCGVDLRILRPGYFYDNFFANLSLIKSQGINGGAIAADVPFPMTDPGDVGAVAAEELAGHTPGTGTSIRELLGPRDYSMRETTSMIGRAIGKPDLPYIQFPDADFIAALKQAGLSQGVAESFAEMGHALGERRVRSLQGRTAETTMPTSFEEFAERFAAVYARHR
jgi:uncharacterized protein YbjT (DUF2867 family)